MRRKIRVLVISPWKLDDQHSWSGVCLPALNSLRQRKDLEVYSQTIEEKYCILDKILTRILGRYLNRVYLPSFGFFSSICNSWKTRKSIIEENPDVIISLAGLSISLCIPQKIPLLQITDSSFTSMVKNYIGIHRISLLSKIQGQIIDKIVSRKSSHYAVASNWSKEVLQADLGIASSKITVIPFGPGTQVITLPNIEKSPEDRILKILFVSADWARKGGDHVLQVIKYLRKERKIDFTVVGSVPNEITIEATHHQRLTRVELSEVYSKNDILIELSTASAGGVVVTDALNHGLPVIATNIQGFKTLVKHQKSGWLVEPNLAIEEVSNILAKTSWTELRNMSKYAQKDAENRLNWNVWSASVSKLIQDIAK